MDYIKIDDFRNFTTLSNMKLSPSGTACAVVGSRANDKNGYYKTIYVDKGNGYFPLTSEKGSAALYCWLNDETILFSEVRDKDIKDKLEKGFEITSFYKININGGEAIHAFNVDAFVSDIQVLPDGRFLITVIHDNERPSLSGKAPEEVEAILKELKKNKNYQLVDELPYWFNERGFINKKRRRLCVCDSDGQVRELTGALDDVTGHKLSPCGKKVLFTGELAPFDIREIKSNLYELDIKSGKANALLKEKMFIKGFDYAGGEVVLAASKGEKYDMNEHPGFYTLNSKGEVKHLFDYDLTIGSSGNTDSRAYGGYVDKAYGNDYYFISLDRYTTDVYKLCVKSGKMENITNCGGNVHFFDIGEKGLVYGAMIGLDLQEVFELQKDKAVKKSSFNEKVLANKKLAKLEHHTIKDKDGYEIDGWVMKPVDYKPGSSYPAILNIHGGPKTAYCESYFHEMQYWANQNYFVLFCNPRGSDGKGNDFAEIRGRYGTVDYDNLIQFTDEMCEKYPDINKSKLGVTGGSYGGFMTNWIAGHTDKFAAAASLRGICNWISMAYISDIGYYFVKDQIQADPWNNLDKIWEQSPLKYAPNVKTPMLILHSDEDFRCWIPEAYQWFTAMKIRGVKTRMYIFHGENHELSRAGRPEGRVRRLEEITNWMDEHLK